MKKRFAGGTLVQERELLRIELYRARGQLTAAKRAARKFAKAYPDNPHLDELDALIKNLSCASDSLRIGKTRCAAEVRQRGTRDDLGMRHKAHARPCFRGSVAKRA